MVRQGILKGPLNSEQKLDFLLKTAPSKIIPFLLKHRYLMIALVLNLPGNALIGGGGGIGLIAGMCRMFPFPKYVLLVSFAITPLRCCFLRENRLDEGVFAHLEVVPVRIK